MELNYWGGGFRRFVQFLLDSLNVFSDWFWGKVLFDVVQFVHLGFSLKSSLENKYKIIFNYWWGNCFSKYFWLVIYHQFWGDSKIEFVLICTSHWHLHGWNKFDSQFQQMNDKHNLKNYFFHYSESNLPMKYINKFKILIINLFQNKFFYSA